MDGPPALAPASPELQPHQMLGVRFNLVTTPTMLDLVERTIEAGERVVFGGHNVHSIYLYHRDPKMRAFFAASPNARLMATVSATSPSGVEVPCALT